MILAYIEEVPAVFFENPGTRSRISSDALVNRHGARARSMCGVSLWLMTVTELILETLLPRHTFDPIVHPCLADWLPPPCMLALAK